MYQLASVYLRLQTLYKLISWIWMFNKIKKKNTNIGNVLICKLEKTVFFCEMNWNK